MQKTRQRVTIPQISDNPPGIWDIPDPAGFIGSRTFRVETKPSHRFNPKTRKVLEKIIELKRSRTPLKEIYRAIEGSVSIGTISRVSAHEGIRAPQINGSLPEVLKLVKREGKDQLTQAAIGATIGGFVQQTISRVSIANGIRRRPTREQLEKQLEARNRLIIADAPNYEQKQLAKRYRLSIAQTNLILRKANAGSKPHEWHRHSRKELELRRLQRDKMLIAV